MCLSGYKCAMRGPPLPFSALPWTPDLVTELAIASAAIGRLDARISATSVAPAWRLRASWSGYARALQLQGFEIDEIDVYCWGCAIRLPGRPVLETASDPFADFATWRKMLAEPEGRHWNEDYPTTFEPSGQWHEAPPLVRALDLLDAECRAVRTIFPWLRLPILLRRLSVTSTPLPCLALGDQAMRFGAPDRPALLKRLLKSLTRAADAGLANLRNIEAYRLRASTILATERRPGKLRELCHFALANPSLAARSVAPSLKISLSGAGKLLDRATRLGLMTEIAQRGSWRTYLATDTAIALNLISASPGRPQLHERPPLSVDSILSKFDSEMAAIDASLDKLGIH